jgi:hypothetical protein
MSELDAEQLARQAQNILNSDAFKIAMEKMDAYTIEMWANGNFKTPQEREEAYGLVRGARTFRARLVGLLEDAKLSKAQAETREKLARSQGTPAR